MLLSRAMQGIGTAKDVLVQLRDFGFLSPKILA
jgi:hypothetical protein